METLKQKWNSRRGASILLALLFLLICMMAGASIVMAAASNGGKAQSNKTEQQKYLTVASAMNMLVDELKSVKYTVQYTCDEIEIPVVDEAGVEIGKYYIDTYNQNRGNLESKWLGDGDASSVLPLRDYLDYVFAENFDHTEAGPLPNHEYHFNPLSLSSPGSSFTLTFEAPSGYGSLNETVTIVVDLRSDGSILLTAALKDDDYTMMALLNPYTYESDGTTKKPIQPAKLLVLKGNELGLGLGLGGPGTAEGKIGPIIWDLEYIFKQEATT